ncbi:phospholipid carrier-dependent glycosyltransferase [uncultured Bifidobacterium sp.]|uniref:dolichyl-phosphate-mannose--protein mannosyltransferase n=1 Tax=uncultured Bifidobacterium sp. TaxID=165187 RepID=UPI00261C3B97|nr:phospholipid carrier-dependent glycosyltransferase [uncultured Bifidobacterium sp.]
MALFGGVLRFFRLGKPRAVVFDETYYVKDAWTMLMTGEARDWPENVQVNGVDTSVNTLFAAGDTNHWLASAEYVVHPPLGKWLIAVGLKLFGGAGNIAAWRVSVAVAGTIAIILMIRVALRMFHNLPIAMLAGFLMSVDGVGIVMSRTGLLDNFIMVFALGAFLMLLIHRDWAIKRLRKRFEIDSSLRSARWIVVGHGRATRLVLDSPGPMIAFSWWRAGAAILLGLATGVKWSGIYFFAAFCVISVLWDAWLRRQVGYRFWLASGIFRDGIPAALYMLPLYGLTYLADWENWFIHPDSYMHNWAANNPGQGVTWLPESLRSFVEYHVEMWKFHTTLDVPHAYRANPLTWPLQIRPTSFYWEWIDGHPGLCSLNTSQRCVAAVTSLGNPLIWWLGSACVIAGIIIAIKHRGDWRIGAVVIGFIGGWLPWAQYLNRTTFTFYSIVILPWIILGICFVANEVRERASALTWRLTLAVTVGAIALVSLFFYPIWTGMPVPYEFWLSHMWLDSWI